MTLRLHQSRDVVIDEAQAALLADGPIDWIHGSRGFLPVCFDRNPEW
jgi:hypothetical protein